jgi:HPt (histidine-containing phosphotransfer) domain-containing protein
MTANAMQGDREECLAAGMDDYVAKPIRRDDLAAALERGADRYPAPGRDGVAQDDARAQDGRAQDGRAQDGRAPDGVGAPRRGRHAANGPRTGPEAEASQVYDPAPVARLLDAFGDDGPALITDLTAAFLAEAPKLLAALQTGLDSGHADEVRRAAHTLKSNGATLGAPRFATACAAVEDAARDGDLVSAERLADTLDGHFLAARAALYAAVGAFSGSPSDDGR